MYVDYEISSEKADSFSLYSFYGKLPTCVIIKAHIWGVELSSLIGGSTTCFNLGPPVVCTVRSCICWLF